MILFTRAWFAARAREESPQPLCLQFASYTMHACMSKEE